jgi:aldehyde dehydrogenase (NAD+)
MRQAAQRHASITRVHRAHVARTARCHEHIIPWNYPLQIFGRSVGGALAAGNACVNQARRGRMPITLRVAQLAAEVGARGAAEHRHRDRAKAGAALAESIGHCAFPPPPLSGDWRLGRGSGARHCPVTLETGAASRRKVVFADADIDAALPALVMPS